jgi:hypothetical protein
MKKFIVKFEKYDEEKRKFEEIDQKVYLNPFEEK